MHIRILAIGNKMPSWVNTGYQEYAKRFPPSCTLELVEIPAEKRTKQSDIARLTEREGEKILNLIKPGNRVIALDVLGKAWSTEQLAKNLEAWHHEGRNIDLLIGGPDGLASACLQRAELKWSLSPLTLPHPLVRIVLAEQLYRALTILQGHPYHR
ncbi:MAG: 23S rRNA (pseudouridine(1915)-N(3))-methyltransferase RlmH [Gammaproteobacteria bacterium]